MNLPRHFPIAFAVLCSLNLACKKEIVNKRPIIYGHAGISLSEERALYPPNSEKAIFYVLDVLDAQGVEVDVQMTLDSVLVLYHDPFLEQEDFKELEAPTCIGLVTWTYIQELNKSRKNPIIKLSDIAQKVILKNKFLCLDLRHYNECTHQMIDFELLNRTLETELLTFSDAEKKRITVNSRNIDLINAVQDTSVVKSFESEDIDLGITYFKAGLIDKITTKLNVFSAEKEQLLRANQVDFCLYLVKTKKEIKAAAGFHPSEIISDNIAATNAYYN